MNDQKLNVEANRKSQKHSLRCQMARVCWAFFMPFFGSVHASFLAGVVFCSECFARVLETMFTYLP